MSELRTHQDVTDMLMSAGYGVVHFAEPIKDYEVHVWHLVQALPSEMTTTELGEDNTFPYRVVIGARPFAITMGTHGWPAEALDAIDLVAEAKREWGVRQ